MTRKFTIDVEMNDRWINQFVSFLKRLEFCGNLGHSEAVAFYADGDGDFRPKFKVNTEYSVEEPTTISHDYVDMFDAG